MALELSVIVTSYNRRVPLLRMLESLAGQDLEPGRFEIVVVLDGSTDGSAEALATANLAIPLHVISQENQGIAAARNVGAAIARGKYLLFVDDDMEFQRGALRAHIDAHACSPGSAVLGRLAIRVEHGGLPGGEKQFWRRVDATLSKPGTRVPLSMFYGGNLSIGSGVFRSLGGLDDRLRRSDDVEFGYRLHQAAVPIVYARDAYGVQRYSKTTAECLRDTTAKGRDRVAIWRESPECSAALRPGADSGRGRMLCRMAQVIAAVPQWEVVARALGAVPEQVPGAERLYAALHMHAYLRGVRASTTGSEEFRAYLARRGTSA